MTKDAISEIDERVYYLEMFYSQDKVTTVIYYSGGAAYATVYLGKEKIEHGVIIRNYKFKDSLDFKGWKLYIDAEIKVAMRIYSEALRYES